MHLTRLYSEVNQLLRVKLLSIVSDIEPPLKDFIFHISENDIKGTYKLRNAGHPMGICQVLCGAPAK